MMYGFWHESPAAAQTHGVVTRRAYDTPPTITGLMSSLFGVSNTASFESSKSDHSAFI